MSKKLLLTLSITMAMLATSMGAVSAQATTDCGVAPAGYNVIESNARYIIGTSGKDFICAGDGVNTIRAKGMDDIIHAGGGNDLIYAGFGHDKVWAGDGDDTVYAGGGADLVNAGDGDDVVFGGQGHDKVNGNAGDDTLTGGTGDDELNGNLGADTLNGNKGKDTLNGGDGNDTINGGNGDDTINGGADDDTINGGGHNDTIDGGNGDDQLRGSTGDDTIAGGGGADAVVGGDGEDTLDGGAGDDTMIGGGGDDTVDGGDGMDEIVPTEGDSDNCIAPDTNDGCDLVDGETPYPGRLRMRVPTMYNNGSTLEVVGSFWTSETVTVTWSAGEGSDEYSSSVPNYLDEEDGNYYFGTGIDYSGYEDYLPTVTDETAGVSRNVVRAIDSYQLSEEDETITLVGTPGKIATVKMFDQHYNLIEDRAVVLTAEGVEVDFSNTSSLVWRIDLEHEDSDGDIEAHDLVWARSSIQAEYQSPWIIVNDRNPAQALSDLTWSSGGQTVQTIAAPSNSNILQDVPADGDILSVTMSGLNKSLEIPVFEVTTSTNVATITGTGTPGLTVFIDLFIEQGIPCCEFPGPRGIGGLGLPPEGEGEGEGDEPEFEPIFIRDTTVIDGQGNWSLEVGSYEFEIFRNGRLGVMDDDGDTYFVRLQGNQIN